MQALRTKTLCLVSLVAALTFQSRPVEAGDNLTEGPVNPFDVEL